MLLNLEIENFFSFEEKSTFVMYGKPDAGHEDECVFCPSLLKSERIYRLCALYGANASGKSNFLRVFAALREFILNPSEDGKYFSYLRPFIFSDTEGYSRISVEFFSEERYRYELSVNHKKEVFFEGLYLVSGKKVTKETPLFEKKKDELVSLNKNFFKDRKMFIDGGIIESYLHILGKKNISYLPVLGALELNYFKDCLNWFKNIKIILSETDLNNDIAKELYNDESLKNRVAEHIKNIDTGIGNMFVSKQDSLETTYENSSKKSKSLKKKSRDEDVKYLEIFLHNVNKRVVGLPLALESLGTQRFYKLIIPILECLDAGGLLIIDELDSSLHPLVTKYIMELFNSKKTNGNNAQIIFSTHDVTLLSGNNFSRGQIWFVEKDYKTQRSQLYSLSSIIMPNGEKPRTDLNYEKNYLYGRFGAVPFVDSVDD